MYVPSCLRVYDDHIADGVTAWLVRVSMKS